MSSTVCITTITIEEVGGRYKGELYNGDIQS